MRTSGRHLLTAPKCWSDAGLPTFRHERLATSLGRDVEAFLRRNLDEGAAGQLAHDDVLITRHHPADDGTEPRRFLELVRDVLDLHGSGERLGLVDVAQALGRNPALVDLADVEHELGAATALHLRLDDASDITGYTNPQRFFPYTVRSSQMGKAPSASNHRNRDGLASS